MKSVSMASEETNRVAMIGPVRASSSSSPSTAVWNSSWSVRSALTGFPKSEIYLIHPNSSGLGN